MSKLINGILVQQFIKGWYDASGTYDIPFDIEAYLNTGEAVLKMPNGATATLVMSKQDDYYEFAFKGRRHRIKLYREWDGVDLDVIVNLESYAIGEYTKMAINSLLQ